MKTNFIEFPFLPITKSTFERQEWVEKLSMSHWNFQELSNGSAWKFMRDYV